MSFLNAYRKSITSFTSAMEEAESEEEEKEDAHDDREEVHSRAETPKDEVDFPDIKTSPPRQVNVRRLSVVPNASGCSNCSAATLVNYLLEKQEQECPSDPIDTFFSLMATTVKKFSAADQHFVKTRVFSLVSEVEGKYLQNLHNYVPAAHNMGPASLPSPLIKSDTSST